MNNLFLFLLMPSLLAPLAGNGSEAYHNAEFGEDRSILWAEGVDGPSMRGGTPYSFKRDVFGDYVDYVAPFEMGKGIYDVNKTEAQIIDRTMCYAASASNALHWFLEVNKENIASFMSLHQGDAKIAKLNDYIASFKGQADSKIYQKYLSLYGGDPDGFFSDLLIDNFINGYPVDQSHTGTNTSPAKKEALAQNGPDAEFGFFYDVFGTEILTSRRSYYNDYDGLSRDLVQAIKNGDLPLLDYMGPTRHVVTVYGVETREDGSLSAIYLADSDDEPTPRRGLYRWNVHRDPSSGSALLSSSIKPTGSKVEYLQIVSSGKEKFKSYLEGMNAYEIHYAKDDQGLDIVHKDIVPLDAPYSVKPASSLGISRLGYDFSHYELLGGKQTFVEGQEIKGLGQAKEKFVFIPRFTASEYQITYDANFDGSVDKTIVETYRHGENKTLIENPFSREGYTFMGWEYEGRLYLPGMPLPKENASITLKAHYALNQAEILETPRIIAPDVSIYEGELFDPIKDVYALDKGKKIPLIYSQIIENNVQETKGEYYVRYRYQNQEGMVAYKKRLVVVLEKPSAPSEEKQEGDKVTLLVTGIVILVGLGAMLGLLAYKQKKK